VRSARPAAVRTGRVAYPDFGEGAIIIENLEVGRAQVLALAGLE